MKVTAYFEAIRMRPDLAVIQDDWIERAIRNPVRQRVQADGRIRRWVQVPEMEDGETVHNAFFDRGFKL